jgi:Cu-Zn family superoxide dismutase
MERDMKRVAMVAAVAVLAGGCSTFEMQGPRAVASLEAAKGNPVWGSVSFVEGKEGVVVRADVRGLRANGEFGFHVHEKGDCSSPDFMSAGGHFNPGGKPHAHHGKPERHAGDLENLKANSEGNAVYVFQTTLLTVTKGPNSVVGRAVVIHANPDDYTSQPAGNSGPRIACGLIRAAAD